MRGKCLSHKINPDPPYSLIAMLTELWQLTEGRKEMGGLVGDQEEHIFWGEPCRMIQKNLYQELLVVYTILL